jgi:hypothetical protein
VPQRGDGEPGRCFPRRRAAFRAPSERDPRVQRGLQVLSDERLVAEITAEIDRLADQLVELDLIGEDNRGTPRLPKDEDVLRANPWAWAIEVEHPEPRLYSRDGVDTIAVTRMREDGRYERAVLDEYGLPIEPWRTVYRRGYN